MITDRQKHAFRRKRIAEQRSRVGAMADAIVTPSVVLATTIIVVVALVLIVMLGVM